MKTFVYLILSAGLMTACGSTGVIPTDPKSDEVPLPATPIPADATNEPVIPPMADTPILAIQQKMVDLSRENLSQKLKISIDQIKTVSTKQVTWKDASLGCPKPGIDYIRVETPGYSIMLKAAGKTYNYHTDENKRVILCKTQ